MKLLSRYLPVDIFVVTLDFAVVVVEAIVVEPVVNGVVETIVVVVELVLDTVEEAIVEVVELVVDTVVVAESIIDAEK